MRHETKTAEESEETGTTFIKKMYQTGGWINRKRYKWIERLYRNNRSVTRLLKKGGKIKVDQRGQHIHLNECIIMRKGQ